MTAPSPHLCRALAVTSPLQAPDAAGLYAARSPARQAFRPRLRRGEVSSPAAQLPAPRDTAGRWPFRSPLAANDAPRPPGRLNPRGAGSQAGLPGELPAAQTRVSRW